ncbi:MAG: hypothetical protein U7126_00810 [Microcoleus sp.]
MHYKYFVFLLLLISCFSIAPTAEASVCRNYGEGEICILDLKRSAKNYWEYRAIVSIDGVKKPLELYNCRSRIAVKKDGKVVPFGEKDPGQFICSFFNKK